MMVLGLFCGAMTTHARTSDPPKDSFDDAHHSGGFVADDVSLGSVVKVIRLRSHIFADFLDICNPAFTRSPTVFDTVGCAFDIFAFAVVVLLESKF